MSLLGIGAASLLLLAAGPACADGFALSLPASDTQVHTRSVPPAAEPGDAAGPAVDLSVVYTADFWRNARGGVKRGWRYLDNLDVTLAVDAERALGWAGATLFLYGLYNNGESLTDALAVLGFGHEAVTKRCGRKPGRHCFHERHDPRRQFSRIGICKS